MPTASLPTVPWISLADFGIIRHERGFTNGCAIPLPRILKPPRTFFLVLTLVDLNGKKYEASTSTNKVETWKYDRITLPDKPQAKVTINVYRSRWRGIPLGYQRTAASEVTIESLSNGILRIHLDEVDSKKYSRPSLLEVSVNRGSGPHPPQPNRYAPGKQWRLRP